MAGINQRYNYFAQKFVDTLPIDPILKYGIPEQSNPYTQVTNPIMQGIIQRIAHDLYYPTEQKQYNQAILPIRTAEAQQIGQNNQALVDSGFQANSTIATKNAITQAMSQLNANNQTDAINAQFGQLKAEEEKRRQLEELGKLKFINDLFQNNLVPNNLTF